MRQNVLMAAVACAALVAPLSRANAQTGSPCVNGNKMMLVSVQQVMGSIPAYTAAESLLAKEADGYKAELAKQQAAFDTARNAYAEGATLMNAGTKSAAIKKLQDQSDALQKRAADLDAKMNQRGSDLIKPIQDRVQQMLDGMRAEYNCSVVINADVGGIASADPSLDVTSRMVDRLKASEPAGTKPPATTGKPPAGGIKPPGGGGGGDDAAPLSSEP